MPNCNLTVQSQIQVRQRTHTRTFRVELDADRFEKLAGDFGFFNPEFLRSLEKSEREYGQGKAKKLKSLRDLCK